MRSKEQPTVRIVQPVLGLGPTSRSILDSLPTWFGRPDANDEYVDFVEHHPTWSAVDGDGRVVGVLAPRDHAESTEIELLAVLPEWHRQGVGRALVGAFEGAAIARGLRLAHVKTLGPSDPDEGYARTRRFYSALGYLQLEETFDLWPDTAALIMVKPLSPPTGEAAVISRTTTPITTATIVSALRAVGVTPGSVIIVHSSMSRLGWIAGDAHSVVDALIASVGHEGTIVMPAHTGLSDPAGWVNPPVPPDWVETIRTSVPAFDPALTPMRGMGRVVECFSRLPEVRHSRHPALGFLAYGPRAAEITGQHWLDRGLDDSSPLGRLYELDARVVLIGVDHGNDTSLHLAEYRADFDGKKWTAHGVPLLVDGVRSWVTYDDLDGDSDDFAEIGQAFVDAGGEELRFSIGAGEIRSCRMRSIVDFAMDWLVTHRSGAEGER